MLEDDNAMVTALFTSAFQGSGVERIPDALARLSELRLCAMNGHSSLTVKRR